MKSYNFKFGISKRELRKKVIKSQPFTNFLLMEYGHKNTSEQLHEATERWHGMKRKEQDKYSLIKDDGSVRMHLILMKNGTQRKTLAFQ